ncbi:hypothetical protein [Candidatus Jettenia sp. AMX1]|uniref:hypothetical protein n=1 Tax=Candidatus Jettenia sp. AMX1 TaxID=2293637 RepID=UPI0025607361|nr:hypothetical protein [Candidatus Jettenia sp. AMX1]
MEAVPAVPAASMLVPFNFQTFQTKEAVWGLDKNELIKMFRVTRRGIAEMAGSKQRNPQKAIDRIIERNPYLKGLGIPVTVTVMEDYKWGHSLPKLTSECPDQGGHSYVTVTYQCPTRTRQIIVDTYDIWGVYQILVESNLPRTKEFLRKFPEFLQAFYNHTIKPPAMGKIKPEVIGSFGVPYKKRGEYVKKAAGELGCSKGTFYRMKSIAQKTLKIPPEATKLTGQPRRPRAESVINQWKRKVEYV